MFSKKQPDMPKGNWKESLAFSPKTSSVSNKKTSEKPLSDSKNECKVKGPSNKKSKPIPKISEKKKKRIKENGSEADLFKKVWDSRSHYCEICGVLIPEPKPESFSHILSKGRYTALRYNPKNIRLVCSMKCHAENDSRNAGNDIELLKQILG